MIIIQYINNKYKVHTLYKECMKTIGSFLGSNLERQIVEVESITPAKESRRIRLEQLSKIPDALWLDADCIMYKMFDFEFEKGYPYIIKNNGCEASAIYCNGRCDIFKELLEEQQKRDCCPCLLIKERIKEFKVFPDGYINHLRLSNIINNSDKEFSAGNEIFTVSKRNNEYTITFNKFGR